MNSKKIAGMQPYFFPYIGYFQLINAVDLFVVYNDGHMIRQGYMHKNTILGQGAIERHDINLQIRHYNCLIYEAELIDNSHNFNKMMKTIRHTYKNAPYFRDVMPIIESCLSFDEKNLSTFLVHQLHTVCDYIGITTPFALSTEVPKDGLVHLEEKAFRIFDHFGIHDYINPIGGTEYYDKERWAAHGVKLSFLKRNDDLCYKQFDDTFVEDLSIIDVMMFNSKEQIQELLTQYTLL